MSEEKIQMCPICKGEMEDTRHVAVECFYAVNEIVPEVKEIPIFQEVPEEASIWGITRQYDNGTKDDFSSEHGGYTEGGHPITKINRTQKPLENPKIRLLEKTMYSLTCCKSCRADFMDLLRRWNAGEFISSPGEGDIPVRIGGTIKYITEDEWHRMRAESKK